MSVLPASYSARGYGPHLPIDPIMSIPSVLLEHFQELQALSGLRNIASRSAECFLADIAEFDQRITTHVDGLLSSAELSQPMLQEHLSGEDSDEIFSAAYVLLRMSTLSAADSVLKAFQTAPPEAHAAFVEAMALAPIDLIRTRLQQLYESAPPLTASAAGEVLARRGQLPNTANRLEEFFKHEDPFVRRTAWRIVPWIAHRATRRTRHRKRLEPCAWC